MRAGPSLITLADVHRDLDIDRLQSAVRDVGRSVLSGAACELTVFGEAAATDPGAGLAIPIEEERRLVIPLTLDGQTHGALEVRREDPLGPDARRDAVAFAAHVACALLNARKLARAERLSFTDDLTSLYNSRFMAHYLDRELRRARRSRAHLALLFMDLDGFKQINDRHGHLAGSATLVEVGQLLTRAVRDSDIVVRYGGDEFVVAFPETPLNGGLIIAERIRGAIEGHVFLKAQRIDGRVSASIGIAAYPECATEVRDLIKQADAAMYRAKELGKNRVVAAATHDREPAR